MNTPEIECKLIDNVKKQAEMEFNARMEQMRKEQLAKKDEEIERLNNILDNIGYQIEGIIRTTENLGITKYTGEVISKHNIEILKNVIKMIETKDVSIGSDKEWNIVY